MPLLGPLESHLRSLAILKSEPANTFNDPDNSTILSCPPKASNLFSAVRKSIPVNDEISSATACEKPLVELIPVPTAVPPMASSLQWSSAVFKRLIPWSNAET